jgi:hypothetical protein
MNKDQETTSWENGVYANVLYVLYMTDDVQLGFESRSVRLGPSFGIRIRDHGGMETGDMK